MKAKIMRKNRLVWSGSQDGSTLVISLLILVLIMLGGIASALVGSTQFKLAGNLQFGNAARNNAESAVSVAEQWLISGPAAAPNYLNDGFNASAVATPHLYQLASSVDPLTMTWSDANSIMVSGTERYIIQKIAQNKLLPGQTVVPGVSCVAGDYPVMLFLVSTRGVSARGSVKILQTVYAVQDRSSGGACTL